MRQDNSRVSILVADDSKEDCLLLKSAFHQAQISNPIEFVSDGAELLSLLKAKLFGTSSGMLPGLILMDLNMPNLSGQETLRALRADSELCHIPVLIMSTAASPDEVLACYCLGANSFLNKPFDYNELVTLLLSTTDYWMNKVELPLSPRPIAL